MKGHASTPAKETIKGPTGSVARLVDRLLQQDPQAQVRFLVGKNKPPLKLASVYSTDANDIVWVDLES